MSKSWEYEKARLARRRAEADAEFAVAVAAVDFERFEAIRSKYFHDLKRSDFKRWYHELLLARAAAK